MKFREIPTAALVLGNFFQIFSVMYIWLKLTGTSRKLTEFQQLLWAISASNMSTEEIRQGEGSQIKPSPFVYVA